MNSLNNVNHDKQKINSVSRPIHNDKEKMNFTPYSPDEKQFMNINNLLSKTFKSPSGLHLVEASVVCDCFKVEPNQLKGILGEKYSSVIPVALLGEIILDLAKQNNSRAEDFTKHSIDKLWQQSSTESFCISETEKDGLQLFDNKQAGKRRRRVMNNSTKNNQLALVYSQETPNRSGIELSYRDLSFKRDPELTSNGNDTNQKTKRTQKHLLALAHKAGLSRFTEHNVCVFCNVWRAIGKWQEIVYNMSDEKIIECLKELGSRIKFVSKNSGANDAKTRSIGFESAMVIALLCSDLNIPEAAMKNFKNRYYGYDLFLHANKFEKKYLLEYPVDHALKLRECIIDAKEHPNNYMENDKTQLEFEYQATLCAIHNYAFNKNGPLILPPSRLYDINPSFTPDILYSLLDS